ncbi:hypothetical protein HOD96_04455 [Candidatus Falkowbacteria bacterium]|nr:hypothetical protein [Candidatus Falkowbacteria bacterium]MBT4433495.1 hypothetical protein [Candidatus Falkowbacteria bacterium]
MKKNGWKEVPSTKEKVAAARKSLEEATEEAFKEFAKPICINTKTIVLD